jgi:hypothetical protein
MFLFLDLIGICSILSTYVIVNNEWNTIILTIGSTILTLGFTLPVALYYQTKHSTESFKIIKSCEDAGIQSIFVSRKDDSRDLQDSIDEAARETSSEFFLSGIAFRTLFDPDTPHTPHIRINFENPKIKMRVMLLNPDSKTAERRGQIEVGGATIDNIRHTIDYGFKHIIQKRIDNSINDSQLRDIINTYNGTDEAEKKRNIDGVIKDINFEVTLYDIDPIAFIMGFDGCLFTEQYHFGRPQDFVPTGGCIGKYVPVIQYRQKSKGYIFLKTHFEFMWNEGKDITRTIIEEVFDLKKEHS